MKNTKLILAALVIAGGSLFYQSCQKDSMIRNPSNNNNSSSSIRAASDEAYMDHQSTYIDAVVDAVTFDISTIRGNGLPDCATVTYDTSGAIKTATVNYGDTPCQTNGEEQEWRQGILVITWTGNMLDSGTVKTVTTQNYFVGETDTTMHQLDFNKTITNLGHNASGNLHFSVVVANATLTLDSGQTVTWSANRERELVQPIPGNASDDYVMISGTSSGTDRNGLPFTTQITNPLRKNADCEWVVSGTKVTTHGNEPSRTLDYGDGTCDNLATITVNGNTTTIHIDKDE